MVWNTQKLNCHTVTTVTALFAIHTLQSIQICLKKVGETFENRNGNFVSLHRQNERDFCSPVGA